jgi:predicted nucleic acid-binding protein
MGSNPVAPTIHELSDPDTKGHPIGFADAWIAACARQLNVPLVTHNASDFDAILNLVVLTAA